MNIQEISLRDVVLSGRHGATAIERNISQTFSVDLSLTFDASIPIVSERLEDTIDYYDVIKVLRKHVEGDRSHVLLESLLDTLIEDLGKTFSCFEINLLIKKPQVPFCPGIRAYKIFNKI